MVDCWEISLDWGCYPWVISVLWLMGLWGGVERGVEGPQKMEERRGGEEGGGWFWGCFFCGSGF